MTCRLQSQFVSVAAILEHALQVALKNSCQRRSNQPEKRLSIDCKCCTICRRKVTWSMGASADHAKAMNWQFSSASLSKRSKFIGRSRSASLARLAGMASKRSCDSAIIMNYYQTIEPVTTASYWNCRNSRVSQWNQCSLGNAEVRTTQCCLLKVQKRRVSQWSCRNTVKLKTAGIFDLSLLPMTMSKTQIRTTHNWKLRNIWIYLCFQWPCPKFKFYLNNVPQR